VAKGKPVVTWNLELDTPCHPNVLLLLLLLLLLLVLLLVPSAGGEGQACGDVEP
jgi:hypothetical protein